MRVLKKIYAKARREISSRLATCPQAMLNDAPLISFTFDDFPASAAQIGAKILHQYDVLGTFYASFGLTETHAPTGRIFDLADIEAIIQAGHEVGCHTFYHSNAWETSPDNFEDSIQRNQAALSDLFPGVTMSTMSYPVEVPRPANKRVAGRYFGCCRGGGQRFNQRALDCNYVNAFFLEQSRDEVDTVKALIERSAEANGWLVFATHDISDDPTRFGCTPQFFETVVRMASKSGAQISPVGRSFSIIAGKN